MTFSCLVCIHAIGEGRTVVSRKADYGQRHFVKKKRNLGLYPVVLDMNNLSNILNKIHRVERIVLTHEILLIEHSLNLLRIRSQAFVQQIQNVT